MAKRVSRGLVQLSKERTRIVNRIHGLLNLYGIRSVQGLHGADWRAWLDRVRTVTVGPSAAISCGNLGGSSSVSTW
jgi:transposase